MKTFVKTNDLQEAQFRGQRQLVVDCLRKADRPLSVDEIEKQVNHGGRYAKLINSWAQENGGVHGSILYHLRELEHRKMIKSAGEADAPRVVTKKKKAAKRVVLSQSTEPVPLEAAS